MTSYSRVEGYSNPLWTFFIAGLFFLPGSPFIWIKISSLLSVSLLLFSLKGLTTSLLGGEEGALPRWVVWLPGLLVVLSIPIHPYVKSGLETVTYTALVLFALWHTLSIVGRRTMVRIFLNALIWIAIALIRPEGILYGVAPGLLFLFETLRQRWSWRELLSWALPIGLSLLLFEFWRYHFYGEWLPNTYYAKVGVLRFMYGMDRTDILWRGLKYSIGFLRNDLPLVTALAALGALFFARRLPTTPCFLLLLSILLNLFYVLWVGGDFFPLSRFLMVSGCVLILFAAVTVAHLMKWGIDGGKVRLVGPCSALALVLFQPMLTPEILSHLSLHRAGALGAMLGKLLTVNHGTPQFFLGKWLKENLPASSVIAIGSCGQIPYYSELETVDLQRLTDHHLARHRLDYDLPPGTSPLSKLDLGPFEVHSMV